MEILKYAPGKNPNSHKKGRRKYSVNDSFFSEPNEVNSYYAGFIAADGCIKSNNSEKSRYLTFGLSIKITIASIIGVIIGTLIAVAKYYCEGNKRLRWISWRSRWTN